MGKSRLWAILFVLLLSGCRTAWRPAPATPPPTATAHSLTTIPAIVSPTIPPSAAPTSLPAALSIPAALDSTPTSTPEPVFEPCSPLGEHDIPSLKEIISAPWKQPPANQPEERHHGIDFAYYRHNGRDSVLGETVRSVLPGQASMVLADRFPYGNAVIVETPAEALPAWVRQALGMGEGESLYLLYAHLGQAPELGLGDAVEACQKLGEAGLSGNAGVAHLHLETRRGPPGAAFESMAFYKLPLTPEEMAAYTRWRTGGEFRHFDPLLLFDLAPGSS